jgi:hypothetical protein
MDDPQEVAIYGTDLGTFEDLAAGSLSVAIGEGECTVVSAFVTSVRMLCCVRLCCVVLHCVVLCCVLWWWKVFNCLLLSISLF